MIFCIYGFTGEGWGRGVAEAQTERPVLDIMLTNYEYPFPVNYLNLKSQGQELTMAYMDVQPEKPNGNLAMTNGFTC